MLVHRRDDDDGVGARDAPSHLERGAAARGFDDGVRAASLGEVLHGALDLVERGAAVDDTVGKSESLGQLGAMGVAFDGDDAPGVRKPRAHHGGEADRPRADDGDRRALFDLGEARAPPSGGEDVTQEQGVLVGDGVGDARERVVREGDAHELRLASVDAAAELPASLLAVVDPTALAEETRAAERLAVHRHTVAGLEAGDVGADLLDHAHELVPQHRVGHRARHRAAHDMQVARADGRARHAHDGVGGKLQRGLRALLQRDVAVAVVHQCFHGGPFARGFRPW